MLYSILIPASLSKPLLSPCHTPFRTFDWNYYPPLGIDENRIKY
jgi:hypothetical protein